MSARWPTWKCRRWLARLPASCRGLRSQRGGDGQLSSPEYPARVGCRHPTGRRRARCRRQPVAAGRGARPGNPGAILRTAAAAGVRSVGCRRSAPIRGRPGAAAGMARTLPWRCTPTPSSPALAGRIQRPGHCHSAWAPRNRCMRWICANRAPFVLATKAPACRRQCWFAPATCAHPDAGRGGIP